MEEYLAICRPLLVEQLQKEIPEYLLQSDPNVLTQPEYERIMSHKRREDRITRLLDILPTKTKAQQSVFARYINDWYPWINVNFNETYEINEVRKRLKMVLNEGEVPAPPYRHVERNDESVRLLHLLHSMDRNEYVVVHGMRGCGKSTLVSSVLHESINLVFKTFNKKVFWVSIGDTKEITAQLDLCGRLTSFHNITPLPLDSAGAKRYLKDKFSREDMQDCLLILDDVPSASFINALDVGCKILITTDDITIMNGCNKRYKCLKVPDGFTEKQTLKLFSDSIQCDKLPHEGKIIHNMGRGFPLTVALIASQLAEHSEDAKRNKDRWLMFVSKLKEDGIRGAVGQYDKFRSKQVTLLYRALGLSIDSLDPELREMYLELAVFKADVNIRPEVLCVFWNKSRLEVIDILAQFEKKTLINKMWSSSKNTYIYCVHDLLLGYLKNLLKESERKELHRKFIDCYREKYGNDFNNFPVDDNYILLYLGYHLKEADITEEFPKLYLNLKFVEKKIVHYGPVDLLLDLNKYKKQIAHNEANSKKYEDFTYFIRRVAVSCRPITNCNLVQFALCECEESEVYKAALELKNHCDPSYLVNNYFLLQTQAPVEDSPPSVIPDRDEIERAAFLYSGDILVANSKGIIRRINVHRDQPPHSTQTFEGHSAPLSELLVKNQKSQSFFLSASDDSTVRVWNANGSSDHSGGSGDFEKCRTPSPQLKQKEWQDMWPDVRPAGETAVSILEHEVPIKCARFSNNPANLNIVTIDAMGRLRIFHSVIDTNDNEMTVAYPEGNVIDTKKTDIDCCSFSHDDSMVLYICSGNSIYIHCSCSGELVKQLNLGNCDIKSLIIIPEISQLTAIILSASDFCVAKIAPLHDDQVSQLTLTRYKSSYGRKREDNYLCAAVSWDSKYVAIATTNYNILIFDTTNGEELLKFNECNGKITNICWSMKNDALLTTYDRRRIMKKWIVQQNGVLNNSVKLRQHDFDAAWISHDKDEEEMCVAAALDNQNDINVFFNLRLEKKLSPTTRKICQICVCPTDGDIVYAVENGDIFLIDTTTWKERLILTCPHRRIFSMKAFGEKIEAPQDGTIESRTLVVVLTEGDETDSELGLSGWRKSVTKNSETVEEVMFEPLPQPIRDYWADLRNDNNALYVVTVDHVLRVYDLSTGTLLREEDLSAYPLNEANLKDLTYCDISTNFAFIVSGSEKHRFLRRTSADSECVEWKSDVSVRTCKFSPDAKYLTVGFDNSNVEIYNVESLSNVPAIKVDHPYKFSPGAVLDIDWSPSIDRFIVIFEREISLYRMLNNAVELYAIIYMSVDKLVSDGAFNRSATVDSSGHFRVLQHPF